VRPVWEICYFVVFIFLVVLIGRFVLELVQSFARDWRPRGVLLVVAEAIYTITDPPLRLLRRLIPPLRLGNFSLDLGMLLLFLLTGVVLLPLFGSLASV
jgi:YggT family protein